MCSFTFGSNNNTAMLRMYQRDRGGAAMTGRSDASVTLQAGSGINRMFGVQGVAATPSTAWFSGSAGKIFKTTNSGTLWSSQVSGTTATLYGLYVASASVAYAVGGTGVMKRTIDGTNWGDSCTVACPFTAADSVKGTDGATTSDVWAVGSGGMIAHSTNADTAGTPTWTAQASGTANQLTSVKAVSTLTAYAVGNTNSIVETVDGGTNWFVLTGASGNTLNDVDVVQSGGNDYIYIASTGNLVRGIRATGSTAPGTTAWTTIVADVTDRSTIQAVSALTKDDVEIADQEGRSFRSTNASTAATFTALGLPESGNWYSLWRAPSGVGYASGTGQIIGYSATGIAPWTKQNPTGLTETAVLRGVAAADLNNAWAVGSTVAGAGTIRHTSDGSTWAGQTSNTTKALFGVSAWSATQAVAVGDAGTAMYTNDGGTTWLTGNTGGVTDDLFSVVAVVTPGGQQRAIAVGANGRVIISDDAGATWTATTAGACRLRGVGSADGMVIYAGCPTGTLERSIDGGSTWSALTPPLANQIYGVSMPDPQTVLFVESGGIVIRSVNADVANPASVTFVTVSNSGSSIYSVDANDANHFSIGGDSGSFKRSLDGTTLLTDTTGSTNDILGVVQVDAVKSWAVGESGRITMTNSIGTVNDFVTATNGWGTSTANSIFGVCLQSVAGSANPDWAVDTGNISGKCEPLVGDAWQAVPGAPTNLAGDPAKIADTPSATSGTVNLVWGFRPASTTPPGNYYATITFDVIAPAV